MNQMKKKTVTIIKISCVSYAARMLVDKDCDVDEH